MLYLTLMSVYVVDQMQIVQLVQKKLTAMRLAKGFLINIVKIIASVVSAYNIDLLLEVNSGTAFTHYRLPVINNISE